jgi:hypothetical protein
MDKTLSYRIVHQRAARTLAQSTLKLQRLTSINRIWCSWICLGPGLFLPFKTKACLNGNLLWRRYAVGHAS